MSCVSKARGSFSRALSNCCGARRRISWRGMFEKCLWCWTTGLRNSRSSKCQIDQRKFAAGRKSFIHFVAEILLHFGRNFGTTTILLSCVNSGFCNIFCNWESSRVPREKLMLCRPGAECPRKMFAIWALRSKTERQLHSGGSRMTHRWSL